jgi:hypothetical protein
MTATTNALAQKIATAIHAGEFGEAYIVFPDLDLVCSTHTPGLRREYASKFITEEVLQWVSDDRWAPADGRPVPDAGSWDRIDGAGERPDFYHLFDRAELIDEGRHILFHIGQMLEPGEPPFLVQTAIVDAYQDEDDTTDATVGWALMAKVVR